MVEYPVPLIAFILKNMVGSFEGALISCIIHNTINFQV